MDNSMWQIIFNHLSDNDIDVYAPAQHKGDCKEPYVVLKSDGRHPHYSGFSSDVSIYDVMCYVPADRYSALEGYVKTVDSIIQKLKSRIKISASTGRTPSFYDDTVKGHMISMQYNVYSKK